MAEIFDVITSAVNLIMNIDVYLDSVYDVLGLWSYLILFLIIFLETGVVVTPFLPGDSFLFAVGTLAATGLWDVRIVLITFIIAAILGDATNYYFGSIFGKKLHSKKKNIFINLKHLEKAELYYKEKGAKTVILSRFIPIIRTFAPFVAGISKMSYKSFARYNIIGALLWVPLFVLAGYFFGKIPIIANNISVVGLIIVTLSVVPVILELFFAKKNV